MSRRNEASARLDELPGEVYVWTQDVYHAPRDDGRTVCGMRMTGGHRRDVAHPPLRSRPCRACFTEAVVERHAPSE